MSSRRGGRGPSGTGRVELPKEKIVSGGSTPKVAQLSAGLANVSLGSAQGSQCEVLSRKPMNRGGSSSSNPWGSQNSNQKAWGQPDVLQKLGLGANRGSGNSVDPRRPAGRGNSYVAPQPEIAPPLQGGRNWKGRPAASQFEGGSGSNEDHFGTNPVHDGTDNDDDDDDSDAVDSDDELLSDDFDSDESVKSHGTRKQSRWFKDLFKSLDELTLEQINEPLRQWHCPACAGGPGAIDWYVGLQPLMAHAKTKGSKRVKLHRDLAELLDEELRRRGTSVVPAGEAFGKWRGLAQEVKDREIVWPPMVCVMNTKLEQDDNDKWIGMGNEELLDYFSAYNPAKARHSYGPQGHRGMSVLIFENTAVGYLDAERLHNHFHDQGSDREAWNRHPKLFYAGGKRQLFGYIAEKHDLTIFNQHSQGKSKLKFEMKSYLEMVVNQLKQMSEDNQALIWFKNRVAKEQRHSKALEESFGLVSEKLRKTMEENRIVRQRSQMHHEQNKEEMDFQEQFFKDQLEVIHKARDAKENNFEKIQQQEREKVKLSSTNVSATQQRSEDVAKFIKIQEKEMEEFVAERERLIKAHEDKKMEMKKRQWEEEVELEKEFDDELNQLMAKYTSSTSNGSSSSNSNGRP